MFRIHAASTCVVLRFPPSPLVVGIWMISCVFLTPWELWGFPSRFFPGIIIYVFHPSFLRVFSSIIRSLIQFTAILGITCFTAIFPSLVLSAQCPSFKIGALSPLSGVAFDIAINAFRHAGLSFFDVYSPYWCRWVILRILLSAILNGIPRRGRKHSSPIRIGHFCAS